LLTSRPPQGLAVIPAAVGQVKPDEPIREHLHAGIIGSRSLLAAVDAQGLESLIQAVQKHAPIKPVPVKVLMSGATGVGRPHHAQRGMEVERQVLVGPEPAELVIDPGDPDRNRKGVTAIGPGPADPNEPRLEPLDQRPGTIDILGHQSPAEDIVLAGAEHGAGLFGCVEQEAVGKGRCRASILGSVGVGQQGIEHRTVMRTEQDLLPDSDSPGDTEERSLYVLHVRSRKSVRHARGKDYIIIL
jgi:hypothetical protein